MSLRPKTSLRVYAHAINNNSQFVKGLVIGAGTGLVIILVGLALAYALDVPNVRPTINGLF